MQYDFDKKEAENKGEVNGFKGTVVEINIHETVLSSVDGKQRITIPNTLVSTAIIIHHEPA